MSVRRLTALTALTVLTALSATPALLPAQQWARATVLDQKMTLAGGSTLTVDVSDADIDLDRSLPAGAVKVVISSRPDDMDWARDRYRDMELTVEQVGRGIRVSTPKHRDNRWGWHDGRGMNVTVSIGVPAELDLDISTGDGDVRMGDQQGNIAVSTGDGDIAAGRLTGGPVRLRTGDGDIEVRSISASEARIGTGDGDVHVDEVTGDLEAQTGDGDLRLSITKAARVSLQTGDGDVSLDMPSTIAATLDLRGEDLNIRGLEIRGEVRNHAVQGDLNGGGPTIRIRTGDGTVRVNGR